MALKYIRSEKQNVLVCLILKQVLLFLKHNLIGLKTLLIKYFVFNFYI